MPDTTVLIPIKREASEQEEEWLKFAISSIPNGTPYLVLRNDGEVSEALNAGVAATETEFYIAMGADDALHAECIPHLEALSWNADVVYPEMPIMDEDFNPIGLHEAVPFDGIRLQQMNYVSGGSLIRRSKALEVGGYRDLGAMEDWDLFVRIFRAGGHFKPAPAAQYYYRQRPDSMNARVRSDAEYRLGLRERIVGTPDPLKDVLATFYTQATPAVNYLRAQLPARHLPGMVATDLFALVGEEQVLFPDHLGDAAVFVYPGDKSRAMAMQAFISEGIRALVEVDDNYLLNPGKEILKNSGWGMKIGEMPHTRQGHKWIAKHASGCIVTTPKLAEAYSKINPNVYVCPNTVDPNDWPELDKPDDGIFRIGWLASLSHRNDIPLITRALEWASRQRDVEVIVIGLRPGWKFPHKQRDWVDDLDSYRAFFQQLDISLAPIIANPFSLYRSDVKALESAMGLAAPVLSDVAPYADWDDTRSIKCKDAKGFYHAIKHLVANRDEAKQLAQAARDYTIKERTTAAQIHLWKEAIAG